jgi:multicomponent Na+:H+ antiporter subunit E
MRELEQEGKGMRQIVIRALALAILWRIITRGDLSSWVVGVPIVVAATLISVALLPRLPWRWRLSGLLRFVPYFLRKSMLGSIDVARRALHPRLPLAPILVEYPVRLHDSLARVFLVNTVSLLPGTLGAELHADHLTVHALDGSSAAITTELEFLEELIADLFGVELSGGVERMEAAHA